MAGALPASALSPAWAAAPALANQGIGPVLLWIGILIAALFVGGYAVVVLRRRFLGDGGGGPEPSPLTLEGIRQLRAQGKLTDEEFEQARAAIIGTVRRDRPSDEAGGRGEF